MYECVYLNRHPALAAHNSDVPEPGSFASKDIFTPHPTIPDIWKYITRLDDRVTLLNGEKVLPLSIEGRIRKDELTREAVVVGVGKSLPGLLIFRHQSADHIPKDEYISIIWPAVEDANSRSEGFSQITRDMIALIPSNVEYPQTDKANIIRAQVYSRFAQVIESMYGDLSDGHEGRLELSVPAPEIFLMENFRDVIGVSLESPQTDFFTAGVDSLQAIQMRRIVQKNLKLGEKPLGSNVIFENKNVYHLARFLYATRTGDIIEQEEEISMMKRLIAKYSRFERHQYLNGVANDIASRTEGQVVVWRLRLQCNYPF